MGSEGNTTILSNGDIKRNDGFLVKPFPDYRE